MLYRISKYILIIVAFLTVLSLSPVHVAYADDFQSTCDTATTDLQNGDAPSPRAVLCPVVRVFNVLILSVGVILIIMIGYGSVKVFMSLGEPKGLAGAKQTWTFAVIGGGIVLFFFVFYTIVANALGLGAYTPMGLVNLIDNGLVSFFVTAQIVNY
jgi:hypothetical protein